MRALSLRWSQDSGGPTRRTSKSRVTCSCCWHLLAFPDGLHINAAAFARGMAGSLPSGVSVSGGLASDGVAFAKTGLGVDGSPRERRVVAITFSGDSLAIATGSGGGWEPFGPERVISRATRTTVFELDDQRALDVYRRYP